MGVVEDIYAVHRANEAKNTPRLYLGGSSAGNPCDRALWYSFRHATDVQFDGRILRLFETGHREEERIIRELRAAGYQVEERDPKTRRQFAVSDYGGHFAGHLDGKIWLDGVEHVLEIKTSNTKGFRGVLKHGVQKHKPVHYAQMQLYCGYTGINRALYVMQCKESDQLLTEVVTFDLEFFEEQRARILRILEAPDPPYKMRDDPGYYLCSWCDHHGLCFDTQAPEVTCGTCMHSTPDLKSGAWMCARAKDPVPRHVVLRGCGEHIFIAPLLERRHGGVKDYEGQKEFPGHPCRWIEYADGTRNCAASLECGGTSDQLVKVDVQGWPEVA